MPKLLPRRFNKLSEQIPCWLLTCQPLGMPLDANAKRMVRKFNRFDESIRRETGNAERWRDIFESLVVQAVDFEDGFAKNFSNMCPFFDFDLMH